MNEPRGPRRFSKYRDGVSLQEHLEKVIELKFAALDKEIAEARRVMEERMRGFPSEFAQKGDMLVTASTLKELKDKDLKELKGMFDNTIARPEYENKHSSLMEKIELSSKEINDLKNERANIQGRIVATGGVIVVVIAIVQVLTQVLIHVYLGKG